MGTMTLTRAALALVSGLGVLGAATTARAETPALACPLSEAGSIEVDGMLDDWQGVAGARAGGKDKDTSFEVRCVHDGARLALAFDVRDDVLVRIYNAKGKTLEAEDRLEVTLRIDGAPLALRLFPGTERYEPRVQTYAGKWKAAPKWLVAEATQQKLGWSFEVELPLAKLAGWSKSAPAIDAEIKFQDADAVEEKRVQDTLEHHVALSFGDTAQLADRFFKETRLKKKDVILDERADLDRAAPGAERVVAGGKIVGVIAETYGYVELPVASPADVLKVQLADLRGDGTRVVVTHLRQHGGGGSRDVVMVWGASGVTLEPLLTVEVRKEADGNKLESRWTLAPAGTRRTGKLKPKGKKKLAGVDLVVEAGPAVGWDEDTFEEVVAEDAEPIHRPWDEARTGGVWWLDGETVRTQALGKPPRK